MASTNPLSLETEQLISNPNQQHQHQHLQEERRGNIISNLTKTILIDPIQWLQMLSSNLNPTFILAIFTVYGLSQGFSGSFFRVVTDYYWKDVQKLQPSTLQIYIGFYYIPWILKPLWGLLTDVFPIGGYNRRPYFVAAGVLGSVSALAVALLGAGLPVAAAMSCLVGVTAGMAIADVTIDACIARNSIERKDLGPDMQSLCGFCSSVGSLIGYSCSGVFVHLLGAQVALVLLAIPPAFVVILGFVIYEVRSPVIHTGLNSNTKRIGVAVKGMWRTIQYPQVWKPSLYMYLSLALSISTHEGQFYWYTHPNPGPGFSQGFIGMIYAVGALASIMGVIIYQKTLKNIPFRPLLFSAQLLYGLFGMLDVAFILRWNLHLGIPDSIFVMAEECVSKVVTRIRWTPMIVLSTRLCPVGIEGTFFALLMCIDSLGSLSSKWAGGVVLHLFGVTRTDFGNLWAVVLLRNMLRLATLGLIFLVPDGNLLDYFVPTSSSSDVFRESNGDDEDGGLLLATVACMKEQHTLIKS
ncbi:Probable folate-biopterin transporter 6 [Linum perenne]